MSITYANEVFRIDYFTVSRVKFDKCSKISRTTDGIAFTFDLVGRDSDAETRPVVPIHFEVDLRYGRLSISSNSFPAHVYFAFTKNIQRTQATDKEWDDNEALFKKLHLLASTQALSSKFKERFADQQWEREWEYRQIAKKRRMEKMDN